MIFSIILIIFFLVSAFIAINYFLDLKKCVQIGNFINDFNGEVNRAWNSEKYVNEFKTNLPNNLKYVCFVNFSNTLSFNIPSEIYEDISLYEFENANMFFYPSINACDTPYIFIEHIQFNNPKCIEIKNGEITINIEKNRRESLVNIE